MHPTWFTQNFVSSFAGALRIFVPNKPRVNKLRTSDTYKHKSDSERTTRAKSHSLTCHRRFPPSISSSLGSPNFEYELRGRQKGRVQSLWRKRIYHLVHSRRARARFLSDRTGIGTRTFDGFERFSLALSFSPSNTRLTVLSRPGAQHRVCPRGRGAISRESDANGTVL